MSVPLFKQKITDISLVDPVEYKNYLIKRKRFPNLPPPRSVVFCYQKSLYEYIKTQYSLHSGNGFLNNLKYINETDKQVAVISGFGIGAPAAVIMLEELIAFGATEFISVGTAGSLQEEVEIGDGVLCTHSLRDEGTSYHYLPDHSPYAFASREITQKIQNTLNNSEQNLLKIHTGCAWTTDAPYRETPSEIIAYQKEGILCVDMEISALFSAAEFRKVKFGALFAISDSLAKLKWTPAFHSKKTQKGLEFLFDVALRALSE